ncbi:unnamed protein product [marine sediment metagenome]|uniref:Uncharacterized protein n=1 Tax=marine sediment metagenome TaxID=412755 RepID=X0SFW0_9ZZZZ
MSIVMDRSEIIYNLKLYLTVVTFKHALYISDISFKEEDVSANQIAILFNTGGEYGNAPIRKRDPLFGNQGQDIRQIVQDELRRNK